ncbi:MAG: ATP-binding protein [Lactobacillaceae bacterium]|nr:ATP-binding protein [Lactobacillaceae bacterium]
MTNLINRQAYIDKIKPFIDTDVIKVLTGLRRSGKSTIMQLVQRYLVEEKQINSARIIDINFEKGEYRELQNAEKFEAFIINQLDATDQQTTYLFFDEIQEVTGFETVLNSLRVSYNVDIFITGSNARMLSSDLATYLAGRYITIPVFPLSFAEYVEGNVATDRTPTLLFQQYLERGGMPFTVQPALDETSRNRYLEDVFNSVVLKDITQRYEIRKSDLLERLILYIYANVGRTFSANSIKKYLKNEQVDASTGMILNYLKYATDAFLLYPVKQYGIQGKKLLNINEKYYISDHGMRNAIYGRNIPDIELILENLVFLELLRNDYKVTIGRLADDTEIDFIGEKNGELVYIQVAYLLATPETRTREFHSLKQIDDNFPKYVLTMDELLNSEAGIQHVNLREFLLLNSL